MLTFKIQLVTVWQEVDMNYNEAMAYIKEIGKYGSVLGLKSIKKLLELMGNPEKQLKAVHVAGTNGKGSTSAFLQSILVESGYKVGRYSSPAVFEYREIIRINDDFIDKQQSADIISFIKEKCDYMVSMGMPHPTPFEIETAEAFEYFKRNKCDIVIIECGMGGESDATNVFDTVLCSIITTISLDHTKFLGNSIKEITNIKSGIIKEDCPVVIAQQSDEAVNTSVEKAKLKNAHFTVCGVAENVYEKKLITYYSYKASNKKVYNIQLNLLGTYQIKNSITAIEAAVALEKQGFKIETNILAGINKTKWPGRLEIINTRPLFVIDGAHNPGAVCELENSIDLYFTNKRITFIMGVLADKDFRTETETIAKKAEKIITVMPNNDRALSAEKLEETVKLYNENVSSANNIENAVRRALDSVYNNESDMILAFGSLSYLGELKSVLNRVKAERRD